MFSRRTLAAFFAFVVLVHSDAFAQYGPLPQFSISIEAISGTSIPGLHSFAFARSGDKWLVIGGRTNGLHGLNSSDGFAPEYKNDNVIVIDTVSWTSYSASLNQLPLSVADPLRSTNMEYFQDGNTLYMAGGFGYDSVASMFVTFPVLTAINVDSMITAVINSQPISPAIRQMQDTNFAVCGGDLSKLGSFYYLCFGHNFGGRYTDPPTPLFTQTYTEAIRKFVLTDDGTTMTVSGLTTETDTANFHRRDLNVAPVILPGGAAALGAYGGVFRKDVNLPFREPITITSSGTTVNSAYQQWMSQYTCALLPVFDSLSQNMYTTFFGGLSMYDFNPVSGLAVYDSLVPFISDVTTMTVQPGGSISESVLPVQLPGLLGSNAKFVLNDNVPHYSNEVVALHQLPYSKVLAGYMLGGIRANQGNLGITTANDTVYRIYINRKNVTGLENENSVASGFSIYPDPANESSNLYFYLNESSHVSASIFDITGKLRQTIADSSFPRGNHKVLLKASSLSPGIYFCRITTEVEIRTIRFIIL